MVGVQVRFNRRPVRISPGRPLRLRYAVTNDLAEPVWWFTEPGSAKTVGVASLHIVMGEQPIPDDVYFFDYEVPKQRRLGPGKEARADVSVDVQLRGEVSVYLTVGYTLRRFKPQTADPWDELIRLQALTAPATKVVRVD